MLARMDETIPVNVLRNVLLAALYPLPATDKLECPFSPNRQSATC